MKSLMILGITQRSGTNYLYDLLNLHPEILPSNIKGEDYLLSQSDILKFYVGNVKDHWIKGWNNSEEALYSGLSEGLYDFLKPKGEGKYFLTRTPDTRNLDNFNFFFRNSKLIILTRDGRDVAESAAIGFGWFRDITFKIWRNSAKRIVDFLDKNKGDDFFMVVKYEDLLQDTKGTLERIFRFCKLDYTDFDFKKAVDIPVKGSSFLKDESGAVNWNQKLADNQVLRLSKRSENWSFARHFRYNYICGNFSVKLGYELENKKKNTTYYLYNFFLNLIYPIKHLVLKIKRFYRINFHAGHKEKNIYPVSNLLKEKNI